MIFSGVLTHNESPRYIQNRFCALLTLNLKMEAAYSSETLESTNKSAGPHTLEEKYLYIHLLSKVIK
jgi:hypothetical protein